MSWAIVQQKTAVDSGTGTTASVTLDSAPTAGNYLVAFVTTGTNGAIAGSGWTAYTSVATGSLGSARSGRFFARKVVGGDGQSYSFTWSGNARWMVSIFEVSGLDTTTVLDVEDAQATTSAANHSTPAVDPTDGAERLVFLGFATKSQSSWSGQTLTSPSTIAATEQTDIQTSQNCHSVATVDQPSIAAGSYVGRGTVASADVGGAHILILRVAGGTLHTQSVGGTLASAGVVGRQPSKALVGTAAAAGVVSRQPSRVLDAALAPAGAVANRPARTLAGALAPAGSMVASKLGFQFAALGGALTPSGAVVRKAARALSGALAPAGGPTRLIARALGGALAPEGGVSAERLGATFLTLAGELAPSGALGRRISKMLGGALTPVGALVGEAGGQVAAFIRDVAGFRPAGREQAAGFRRGEPPAARYGGSE